MCLLANSLPKAVKMRARALKNLQVDQINLEAKFYEEVQQLEAKYQSMYQPLFDKVSWFTPQYIVCTARIAVTSIAMNIELGIQCIFWFLFTIVCLLCQLVWLQ